MRVDDFVGRCLGEQMVSATTLALTLTYEGDRVEAGFLYYKHVQDMLKRLRKAGFQVRYMCAGEYGEKKGRAHWHIILFFKDRGPDLAVDTRVSWEFWPYGLVYAQNANYEGFRYLLKYTLKQAHNHGQKKVLRLSKYPPIGAAYFQDLAERMVDAQLPMHSPEYAFMHVREKTADGRWRPRKFWLTGRSLDLFLEHYVDTWEERHGRPPPDTEFLWERFYDPQVRVARDLDVADLEADIASRSVVIPRAPEKNYAVQVGYLLLPGGELAVKYSNGTAVYVKGSERWLLDVSAERAKSVSGQLRRLGMRKSFALDVSRWLNPAGVGLASGRPQAEAMAEGLRIGGVQT